MSKPNQFDARVRHAPLIRQWLTTRLIGLRSYISMLPDSTEVVDKLRGEDGEKRAARIINHAMKELGYEIETPVESKNSQVRRAVAGVFGSPEK